jgi:hypothetical protein
MLFGRASLFGQVAVKCLDEGLVGQLPFLFIGSANQRRHAERGGGAQRFVGQPGFAYTSVSRQ